ncbi:MAG: hypothetical protein WC729_15115 [Sphingomonas sp.]|jgi:hypothetical protein
MSRIDLAAEQGNDSRQRRNEREREYGSCGSKGAGENQDTENRHHRPTP